MMLAVSANNLLMVYLTVEAVSLLSYVLAGFLKHEEPSSEAGLKYFLFGALATGIMLYGISFLYGIFGTLDFGSILTVIGQEPTKILILVLALIFLFVGLCFKCGLAPFHMWIPDVYQGAPTPVTALLSVGPKAVGFALLIRLFSHGFSAVMPQWILLTSCLAVASMSIGNILAIPQTNIKRLLAYSSIAQAGYIAVGLAVGSVASLKALIFYVIVYALMNLVAFGCVILNFRSVKSDEIADYAGLYKKDPVGALCMTLALLSLAGIPPLAGFWGKFLILSAAVEKHFYVLAIVLILNSLVAVYYYLRIVKVMYLSEPKTLEKPAKPFVFGLALVGGAACIVAFGIFPHLVFNWISIFK
jgi:proton-translocating NADH-quinone oxidoreductase chain N